MQMPEGLRLWEKNLAGAALSEQGYTLSIDNGTVLNIVVDVPSFDSEKLVLWFGDHSLGSLESLEMKPQR